MAEWHCQKCEMNFAVPAPPEKCPACGSPDVVRPGSPLSLAGKLSERYQCDGCARKGSCAPADRHGCCD